MLLGTFVKATRALHAISLILITLIGASAVVYTVLCAVGLASWLTIAMTFGDVTYPEAGFYLQLAGTVIAAALMFFIPANNRILSLEHSHRSFQIRMEDVAKAYHHVHTADRTGMFTLSSEFDAVRERLAYLRDHPDLETLEPGVMEVAAQMSQQARHLADVYSFEKVARAKDFLRQRQQEAEMQQERIIEALHACTEIRKWAQQVELEESIVASQLAQLDEQLQAALPALGYSLERAPEDYVEDMLDDEGYADAEIDVNADEQADINDPIDTDDNAIPAQPDKNVVSLAQKPAAE